MKTTEIKKFHSDKLCEDTYHIYHKSGLFISYVPKKKITSQAILGVKFGGKYLEYEKDGEVVSLPMGCAHFLEHKMFDNPDGSNADAIINSYGGYCNAFTSYTKTAYYFSTSENFYECLHELIRFVTSPYFTEESVNKEIGIIAEEIRGCVDDPYDRCYVNLHSALYKNNTVRNEIGGTEESISKITPETLYKCCDDFYVPQNMCLCISGNLDVKKIIEVVDACIPYVEGAVAKETLKYEPDGVAKKYISAKMQLAKPICSIGLKITDIPEDKRERLKQGAALDVLCRMIFSQSEEFYLDLLDKKLISPGFDSSATTTETYSYISFSGESSHPRALLKEIKNKLMEIKKNPLDAEAFEREKRCDYAGFVMDFDSSEDISFMLLSYASGKDNMTLFEYLDIIESIDLDYVKKLADKIIKEENIALSAIYPL